MQKGSSDSFAKTNPDQSGFTLIEMMVVVAIIGLSVSMAMPSYLTKQAIARQKEAKTSLSAAYVALMAFSAETTSFTICLADIGVEVANATTDATHYTERYYTMGYKSDGADKTQQCGPLGDADCNVMAWGTEYVAGVAKGYTATPIDSDPKNRTACDSDQVSATPRHANTKIRNDMYGRVAIRDDLDEETYAHFVTQNTFKLSAAGQISNSYNDCTITGMDIWTIDQNKNLSNACFGASGYDIWW